MRVLIDHGGHAHFNLGDNAMLQMTVRRLRGLFPDAHLDVMTASPERLATEIDSDLHPVSLEGRWNWFRFAGEGFAGESVKLLRRMSPGTSYRIAHGFRSLSKRDCDPIDGFYNALRSADLVIASGGGYLTDSFFEYSWDILQTLQIAQSWGKPTAMFSQGMGPLDDEANRQRAAKVLAKLDLIAVREVQVGPRLLRELGVPASRICITGDDAVELANARHPPALGNMLGISLRCASYSHHDERSIRVLRGALGLALPRLGASVMPVPISFCQGEEDWRAINQVMSHVVEPVIDGATLHSLSALLPVVARCRVVVTGSYHAAVFAMAQGISVIGLVRSDYYAAKLGGAMEQFGGGEMIDLRKPEITDASLADAISRVWENADQANQTLLPAADKQIEASRDAYASLVKFFSHRHTGTSIPSPCASTEVG